MSLLFPDQIRIGLGASYAALAKVRGSKVMAWRLRQFAASATQPVWQPSLNCVDEWMAELAPHGAEVKVALSAELAAVHLLPWRDDITRAEQQVLLAQSHFRRIFDDTAEQFSADAAQWKTSVYPTAYGAGWLASGVDNVLLHELTQHLHGRGKRLQAVTPLSISLFNGLRQRLQKTDCWLLVNEPEKLVALHLRQGRWQLLLTLPAATLQHEPAAQMLLRETRLAGLADTPTELFVVDDETTAVADSDYLRLASGWRPAAGSAATNRIDHSWYLLGAAA